MPRRLPLPEFVAILAMAFASIALSIDAMLPALPIIAAELSPTDPNKAQLVLSSYILGMAFGTLMSGPLSDAYGRKKIIALGAAIYIAGAFFSWIAGSLEAILIARMFQGVGAAAPRVVGLAIVRDLYSGREMARIGSFIMMVFTVVPAMAPLIGSWIIVAFGWRAVFLFFILFCALTVGWLQIRLDESLPQSRRIPMRFGALWNAAKEVVSYRTVRLSILVQSLCFGMIFATINSVHAVYEVSFGKAEVFSMWFAIIGLLSAASSMVNAALVVRLGMRFLLTVALAAQVAMSSALLVALTVLPVGPSLFGIFLIWQFGIFFQAGLTIGNANALAMEPVGHIAGTAASVISAIATVISVILSVPIGLAFDGTPQPLAIGICGMAVVALILVQRIERVPASDADAAQ